MVDSWIDCMKQEHKILINCIYKILFLVSVQVRSMHKYVKYLLFCRFKNRIYMSLMFLLLLCRFKVYIYVHSIDVFLRFAGLLCIYTVLFIFLLQA